MHIHFDIGPTLLYKRILVVFNGKKIGYLLIKVFNVTLLSPADFKESGPTSPIP